MVVVWWCGAAFLLHYIDGTTNFGLYQKILTENVRSKPCNCWNSKRPQNEGCNQSLDQIQLRNSAVTLRKMLYAQERLNVTELKLFLHTDAGHQKRVVSCSACCFFTGFWLVPSSDSSSHLVPWVAWCFLICLCVPVPVSYTFPPCLSCPVSGFLPALLPPSCPQASINRPESTSRLFTAVKNLICPLQEVLGTVLLGCYTTSSKLTQLGFFLWTWKWNVKGSFSYGWKKKNLN